MLIFFFAFGLGSRRRDKVKGSTLAFKIRKLSPVPNACLNALWHPRNLCPRPGGSVSQRGRRRRRRVGSLRGSIRQSCCSVPFVLLLELLGVRVHCTRIFTLAPPKPVPCRLPGWLPPTLAQSSASGSARGGPPVDRLKLGSFVAWISGSGS